MFMKLCRKLAAYISVLLVAAIMAAALFWGYISSKFEFPLLGVAAGVVVLAVVLTEVICAFVKYAHKDDDAV